MFALAHLEFSNLNSLRYRTKSLNTALNQDVISKTLLLCFWQISSPSNKI